MFDLSVVPNSTELDPHFGQFQVIAELERRDTLGGEPGKLALTGFLTRGRMGRYADALSLAGLAPPELAPVRRYASRGGISVDVEQQLSGSLGVFARAGWADGDLEPYEFADIDRTLTVGASLGGAGWARPDDCVGLAGVMNDVSAEHRAFLAAGGLGLLVGDGQLPHPGPEGIVESDYRLALGRARVTLDYQLVVNPGYNRDRGPVSILALRVAAEM